MKIKKLAKNHPVQADFIKSLLRNNPKSVPVCRVSADFKEIHLGKGKLVIDLEDLIGQFWHSDLPMVGITALRASDILYQVLTAKVRASGFAEELCSFLHLSTIPNSADLGFKNQALYISLAEPGHPELILAVAELKGTATKPKLRVWSAIPNERSEFPFPVSNKTIREMLNEQ